jgi:hypothetical protein
MLDDARISRVGEWGQALQRMFTSKLYPAVMFYEQSS